MTSEDSEMWKVYKRMRKEKRASNRESGAIHLFNAGIRFTEHNNGAHLIVEGKTCLIDYWPGTGRWNSRDGTKGFGIRNLLEYVK